MISTSTSSPGGISVPVAIVLGLISSFIQSLGLTIQRKSHIQNASLAENKQRSEWRRPLWLVGFIIFIVANIGGTVFQIGALPIVMLAPLGAVSLLYNALLARFILDDFFSRYMIAGTALIAAGAVLIGYFGVVQEPTHSLDDLLALYSRPTFIAFASIFALAFVGILSIAHLAEWQLHIRLFRPQTTNKKGKSRNQHNRRRPKRRWSAPSLAPVAEVSESSSGIATPVLEIADEAARRGIPVDRVLAKRNASANLHRAIGMGSGPRGYGTFQTRRNSSSSIISTASTESSTSTDGSDHQSTSAAAAAVALHDPAVRRTCLGLAIAYGGASGTLSGACLLLAKSGVELLVMTIGGENQFDRWQSWFLVVVMLMAALLQLWYLNKSLRLADPTLVCPLAFCFYNTSSIMLGLVYFNQLGSLSWTSLVLVVVGIAVLLAGVWTVSMHGSSSSEDEGAKEEEEGLLANADYSISSSISPTTSAESQTVLSPLESDNATERDALLANVGGIGGPHLPPPTATTSKTGLSNSPEITEINLDLSPKSPKSPSESVVSAKRRTRSRSGSGSSIVGGLGMHFPGLPVQSIRFDTNGDGDVEDVEALADAVAAAAASTTTSNGKSPLHHHGGMTSPRTQQHRRRRLYEALLERGLSIGISPSSPGFHLKHSFELDEEAGESSLSSSSLNSRRRHHHPRRTVSEADVGGITSIDQEAQEVSQEEQAMMDSDQDQTGSAWGRVMPTLDYNALSDRLSNLTSNTRGWFGGIFRKGSHDDEQ